MGWLFKKKKDVIDLTQSQKRGIVRQAEKTRDEVSGYKDLGNADIFSAISSSNNSGANTDTATANKIDDIEFKLDNLRKKIDDILNRLEVIEKKAGVHY